jgi:dihydrofolate reductase
MIISIIAAVAKDNVIGMGNEIPWYLSSDFKRFASLTKRRSVIMGKTTFESIVKRLGNSLPERKNIVLAKENEKVNSTDCFVAHSLDEALKMADSEEVFIIGGASVYKQAIDKVDRMYLTLVDAQVKGDAFFPNYSLKDWDILSTEKHTKDAKNNHDFTFVNYQRKSKSNKIFVDLKHARFDDQRQVMEQIIKDGLCPFCMENLFKYHKKKVLKNGKYWLLTYIQWPRDNTRVHLLAIYKPHAEKLSEIKPIAGKELLEFLAWAEKKFKVKGGAFAIRFGDSDYSAASVKHIHAQFIVPDVEKEGFEPVRFKVGLDPHKQS